MKKFLFLWVAVFAFGCDLHKLVDIDPRPQPLPVPVVEPVVVGEFRCLILLETADQTKLPRGQQGIIASTTLRAYMKTHATNKYGDTAFRIWDKDLLESYAQERPSSLEWPWAAPYMESKPVSYPWLYAWRGKKLLSIPLPANADAVIAAVKPYAEVN